MRNNSYIRIISKQINRFLENITLADPADEFLPIGDFYMVDTKEELKTFIDELNLGDSVGLIQGSREYTITLEDTDTYSFVTDNGTNPYAWEDISKEEVMDLIDFEVRG